MHEFECIVLCIKGYPPDAEKYKTFIAKPMSSAMLTPDGQYCFPTTHYRNTFD